MKSIFLPAIVLIVIFSFSCSKDKTNPILNTEDSISFQGTFKLPLTDSVAGTVALHVSDGYYVCNTNLPYGYGAGELVVQEKTLNFIDTLFFVIPAIYGPSYVLSGEYNYEFDGENLKISRELDNGSLTYSMKR